MKRLLSAFFSIISAGAVAQSAYNFSIDLTACTNDKLQVELLTPAVTQSEVIYSLPRMVPGTYDIYDFGRFVSDLKAFDSAGKELPVAATSITSWKISEATNLARISYSVEDTWDTEQKDNFVFEPGGSNFEAGKNFVLNAHCLYGYFEGMTRLPYRVTVKRPDNFYGACSLLDFSSKDNTDTWGASDYMSLQDAPMMYCVPDTTSLLVGGAEIMISVYSPNKVISSKYIAENIHEILIAQKEYLGGSLPIKKYVYLIYLTPDVGGSGSNGALEHSYSSMYFLPEMSQELLTQTIKDVSAHEFFHIVTPLNIHADQIGNFDYSNPVMSEHLWLYEGLTEYAAGLVQVKYGKMTVPEYLQVIEKKLQTSRYYNDTLPFTVMSKGALDIHKEQYGNVYQKGALIGLCLDLKLRSLSEGKYGVQELMADLAKTYGKEKSFKDEELFDKIAGLTYPEIGKFLRQYVAGKDTLPIESTLRLAGVGYGPETTSKEIGIGGVSIGLNAANNHLVIVNTRAMDDFGKALGYREFDELVKFNGQKIGLENVQKVIGTYLAQAKEGDVLKITVLRRKNETSKPKKVKLKAKVVAVTASHGRSLTLLPGASEQQLRIRKAWIGKTQ
jgi:predicted metalloprotease with PDZ domain